MERALSEEPRPGADRKLAASEEALLVATACSAPPAGRARWTLELLAGEMVRLTEHDSVSAETIRRRLAENELKPWQKKMWCIPKVDAEFVARMEDVLELYAEPPDERRPVVCFDETPRQLIGEARVPVARRSPASRRASTTSTCATARPTSSCSSTCTGRGVTPRSPTSARASTSPSACATSSTCTTRRPSGSASCWTISRPTRAAALYESFEPAEARRILRRLEFHFTPKHASWLNMVEIEIGVMVPQCLDRRIPEKAILVTEVAKWERRRNRRRREDQVDVHRRPSAGEARPRLSAPCRSCPAPRPQGRSVNQSAGRFTASHQHPAVVRRHPRARRRRPSSPRAVPQRAARRPYEHGQSPRKESCLSAAKEADGAGETPRESRSLRVWRADIADRSDPLWRGTSRHAEHRPHRDRRQSSLGGGNRFDEPPAPQSRHVAPERQRAAGPGKMRIVRWFTGGAPMTRSPARSSGSAATCCRSIAGSGSTTSASRCRCAPTIGWGTGVVGSRRARARRGRRRLGVPCEVQPGGGAIYGPKLEFVLRGIAAAGAGMRERSSSTS